VRIGRQQLSAGADRSHQAVPDEHSAIGDQMQAAQTGTSLRAACQGEELRG
jgi:hypothetical protein